MILLDTDHSTYLKYSESDREVIPFDEPAARRFDELRSQRLRVGTMDLKTAAIALVHGALLLSANRQDFERVPGLRVESWLDE